jgi:hypothetical protein
LLPKELSSPIKTPNPLSNIAKSTFLLNNNNRFDISLSYPTCFFAKPMENNKEKYIRQNFKETTLPKLSGHHGLLYKDMILTQKGGF